MSDTKRCRGCGDAKPVWEYGEDNLNPYCAACTDQRMEERDRQRRSYVGPLQLLDLEWGERDRNTRRRKNPNPEKKKAREDARRYRTNPERAKKNSRAWQKANPERVRENVRRWQKKNPEKVRAYARNARKNREKEKDREYARKWREANPEKARAAVKRWHEANPEKAREHARKWRAAHPDYWRKRNAALAKKTEADREAQDAAKAAMAAEDAAKVAEDAARGRIATAAAAAAAACAPLDPDSVPSLRSPGSRPSNDAARIRAIACAAALSARRHRPWMRDVAGYFNMSVAGVSRAAERGCERWPKDVALVAAAIPRYRKAVKSLIAD